VYNGDDSISLKGNSTDITITNSHFYNGLGIALGSIGQYKDQFETIERFTVKNIDYHNTLHAVSLAALHVKLLSDLDLSQVYFKTWTDDQNGYPPNGGGGGLGCMSLG
jgi:hypothetical protein